MVVARSCPSLPIQGASEAPPNAAGVVPKTADQEKAQAGTDHARPGQLQTGGGKDGTLGPHLDVPRASADRVGERVTSSPQHAVHTGSDCVPYDRHMSVPLDLQVSVDRRRTDWIPVNLKAMTARSYPPWHPGSSLCFHCTYRT